MALIDKLTAIADAIRSKTGSTEAMTLDGMAEAVAAIEAGGGDNVFADFPVATLTVDASSLPVTLSVTNNEESNIVISECSDLFNTAHTKSFVVCNNTNVCGLGEYSSKNGQTINLQLRGTGTFEVTSEQPTFDVYVAYV